MLQKFNSKYLLFHPDTVDVIREEINLRTEEDIRQVVKVLKDWIALQPHFRRKEFPDEYLERWIVAASGSVEKAKIRFDKICTIRTLSPRFFEKVDIRKVFDALFHKGGSLVCPKLTKEHYRVVLTRATTKIVEPHELTLFYKFAAILGEYVRSHDYVTSFHAVYDFGDLDLVKFVSSANLVELRQVLSIFLEGYGMKIKGVHIITKSKGVELLVNIARQILKPKIMSRLHVYKTYDEVIDIIGKDVLPVDLGGTEKPFIELMHDMIDAMTTKEFTEYLHSMNAASTDEKLRQNGKFSEEYAGTPGTFRVLTLD